MFNNVGRKVQVLAKVMCWLGIIASVIYGIVLIAAGSRANSGAGLLTGILTMAVGSLASWLSSLATYAIGEAAEYAEKH